MIAVPLRGEEMIEVNARVDAAAGG